MFKPILALFLTVTSLQAQDSPFTHDCTLKASLAAVAVSQALYAHSSVQANDRTTPLFFTVPDRQFTSRTVRNNLLGVAGAVAVEYVVTKKWPSTAKVFKWVNFVYVGALVPSTVSNYRVPAPPPYVCPYQNCPVLPGSLRR